MLMFSLVILLFESGFTLEGSTYAEAEVKCGNADAGFLLDMSDTISNRTYHRQIKLIQGLVRAFDVSLGGSRAGLVTFSDNAVTNFDFDMHPTTHDFNRAVRRLDKYGGRTRIDRGIDESTLILYNQKYNLKLGNEKYLFVISDGKQTWDYVNRRKTNLKERTWLLRHQGVKIIAIAMGDHPDLWYLHQLVQNPEMEVIVIRSRSNIKAKVEEIRRIACSPQPAVSITCTRLVDMGFLLDQSSSIGGPAKFRFETSFVKDVVDKFGDGQNDHQIRAGVIKYGEESELLIKLDEFKDLKRFKNALDQRAKFKGSRLTRIDRALEMANKQLFTIENGDRPGVPNYLILVTDGRQNSGIWDIDYNLIPRFAKPLWDRNITIAAIGVAQARLEQLKEIAGPHGSAIYKERLQDLEQAVDEIIPMQCKGCHEKVNLGFLVDASRTLRRHYYKMKRLVYYIAEAFKPQRTKLLASVIRFSTKAKIEIRFGQFDELSSFQAEIDTRMPYMGGNTYIDRGLRAAEKEFEKNADKKLPKVLIVLTDGRQTGGSLTLPLVRNAVNDLKQKRVRIVVVAVGAKCKTFSCQGPLDAMTGGGAKIVRWKSTGDMMTTSEMVARIACPRGAKGMPSDSYELLLVSATNAYGITSNALKMKRTNHPESKEETE